MATHYEWVIEELDRPDGEEDCEITDVNHADTYAEALKFGAGLTHFRIGLVRDRDDDNRAWAYVEEGVLATHCEDAFGRRMAEVPKKFRAQFDAAQVKV